MSDMQTTIKLVEDFHNTFKIGNASKQTLIDEKDYILRFNLINEENEEYLEACKNNDLSEIADALGDQLYILCGTILKHGLQYKIDEVFKEIHQTHIIGGARGGVGRAWAKWRVFGHFARAIAVNLRRRNMNILF